LKIGRIEDWGFRCETDIVVTRKTNSAGFLTVSSWRILGIPLSPLKFLLCLVFF
jgi:hypothetical protein